MSYDGSADAQAAIDRVAQLMPGAEATVFTVWEPFMDSLARTGSLGMDLGMAGTDAYASADWEKIDAANREAARASATDGAQRATAARLVAHPRAESRDGDVANTILAAAVEVDAEVIVMGTRGLAA